MAAVRVGEKSKIPDIGGIRKELVGKLRELRPALVRWPGRCLADQYDWRDGVGPQRFDPNHLNTIEYFRFCRLDDAGRPSRRAVAASAPRRITLVNSDVRL